MSDARTYRDRVAALLMTYTGTWVDAETLMAVGGRMAWRTRVSDCRTQLGMAIENRQRKEGRRTVSEYRYVPPVGQLGLW